MKRSSLYMLLILLLLGALAYFFTPLGPRARGYAGRLWSKSAVAFKTDRQLDENAYRWLLTDIDGNAYNLKKAKGQAIFLNFWATWCGPCLKEMPDIQKLYDDYGEKVTFLLVTQEDTEKVEAFMKKKNYRLPIYFTDKEDIPEEIASKSLPTTYIIDATGKIVRAETGATNWNSDEVRRLFEL
ncbi:MAG: TlpA disulfide reductase family protein, partial [Pricia sp.]